MKVIDLGGNERKNQNKDLNKLEARFVCIREVGNEQFEKSCKNIKNVKRKLNDMEQLRRNIEKWILSKLLSLIS